MMNDELLLVLAAGTTVIVLAAALAAPRFRWAVWQRTIWQAATAAVIALLAAESIGAGNGLVGWLRTAWPSAGKRVDSARPIDATPDRETSRSDTPCLTSSTRQASDAGRLTYTAAESLQPAGDDGDRKWEPVSEVSTGSLSRKRLSEVPPASFLVFVWAVGALGVLARTLWARWRLLRICRRAAEAVAEETRSDVDRIADRVGLRGRVRLLEYAGLNAPAAFGIVRRTVALPPGFRGRFSPVEQDAVLAHELRAPGRPGSAVATLGRVVLRGLVVASGGVAHAVAAAGGERGGRRRGEPARARRPRRPGRLPGSAGRGIAGPAAYGWISVQGSGFRSGLGRRVERLLNLKARASRGPMRAGLKSVRRSCLCCW